MSTPNDLPWRMSAGQKLDAVRTAETSSVSSSAFVSFLHQFFSSHTTLLRRGIVALAIPAALFGGAVLANDRQEPEAVSFAVRNTDVASVEAADAVVAEVDVTLGRPTASTGSPTVWLNLRSGPSAEHGVITVLAPGSRVQILGSQGGWYNVSANGATGWVYGTYLQVGGGSTATPANNTSALVIGSYANLRRGPGYNHAIIGSATYGTTIRPLAKNNGWFKVRTPSGAVVWIVGWLTNISSAVANSLPYEGVGQAPAPQQAVATSGDVATIALSYVGYPYAYGGAGPGAFDCSGLTQWVYRQVGVWLPRTASAQYGAAGTRVGMGALQPGDLVFFAGTYAAPGITHAAVYVGNGRMVSAGTPATGVTVESIYGGYWSSKFVGGLRVAR